MKDFIDKSIAEIRETVKDGKVLLALSGGVDSSVLAELLTRAVGRRLYCIFVDTGLMRKNEGNEIEAAFGNKDLNFIRVNAEERFLSRLRSVTDPEQKRKIIGEEFIRVFEEEAKKLGRIDFLAQGTIYPDIIESGEDGSKLVKSHHNVGGLPENIGFKGLIEPLKMLYKEDVRSLASELSLPDYIVNRQPFPGPGLAVRCIGEVTKERLDILREADFIFRSEIENAGADKILNQYFAILTDTCSTGVAGGERIYGSVIALRAVMTTDFVTADFAHLSYDLLASVSKRITNEIKDVSRVLYDITAKPPSTIEFE